MRLCLAAPEKTLGVSYTDATYAKKAGFDFYELDLRAIKTRLGRGGSVSDVINPPAEAGLKAAIQTEVTLTFGFGRGIRAPDPSSQFENSDLLDLASSLCARTGASLIAADPFLFDDYLPELSSETAREDLKISMMRVIAGHPYLNVCIRPDGDERSALRNLDEALLLLNGLNRHEAGIIWDLKLLGERAFDCIDKIPSDKIKALRLSEDKELNREAIRRTESSNPLVCATLDEISDLCGREDHFE